MDSDKLMRFEQYLSLDQMKNMHEGAQLGVLEMITNDVRNTKPV